MADPALEMELQALQDAQRASRSRLTTLARITRGLSIALCLVLIGFLVALYSQVTAMYDPQNFQEPVQREAEHLLPTIEPELVALWQETAPVYGELALAKFEQVLPQVQEASLREIDALQQAIATNAEDRVRDALERIAAKHTARLSEQLPRLSTEQGADELGMRWMESVEKDLEQVVLHFHDQYSQDLGDLQASLDRFLPNDFESMTEDELFRQFVHLWLTKADRWVLLQDDSRPLFEGNRHGD